VVSVGRDGDGDRIDTIEQVACVEDRPGAHACGNFLGSLVVRIGDGNELDAAERRENAGVMTAEMAHADDADTQRRRHA
jgi:hypothetical protein